MKSLALVLAHVFQTVPCVIVAKPALYSDDVTENSSTTKVNGIRCRIDLKKTVRALEALAKKLGRIL